jgi:hypothetical protein
LSLGKPTLALAILLGVIVLPTTAGAARKSRRTPASSAGARWWKHVQYLAGDELRGRATGSEGHYRAAEYVAREFERAGLKPAGTSGFFQPMKLRSLKIIEAQSYVNLARGGVLEVVELGEDVFFSLRGDPAARIDAPAVFVGYGLKIPEANHDDLAGVDLKGKIAVYLQGGPARIPGPLKAHYQSSRERWRALEAAGAIGTAAIANPKWMDIPWERLKLLRFQPFLSLADQRLADSPGQKISLMINPAKADKFFSGTPHTMAEILALAAAGDPLPKFPLVYSIRATIGSEQSEGESGNVVGILPGSDPKLKNEYIALSAHLDHLGVGEPVKGDSIYNGAMDNAIGVASLIELAGALKRMRPRRSVLFLAVTAEEKGLLGSQYFATFPTVPRESIVANANLDMYLPIHPLRILTVYGLAESTLADELRKAAAGLGVHLAGDSEPDRNVFIRSDQYSFIRRGIPSLFFKFGYPKGSSWERLQKRWLRERYHSPSDDAKQPVNLAAAARFNQLIARFVAGVARAPGKPRWRPASFFLRYTERET